MKKHGILLKMGLVAIAATIFCSSSFAQDGAKKAGRKDVSTKTTKPVVHSQLDPTLAAKQNASTVVPSTQNGKRQCTPKSTANPYSISRKNFNMLPKDKQEFVLNHLDKYSIVD